MVLLIRTRALVDAINAYHELPPTNRSNSVDQHEVITPMDCPSSPNEAAFELRGDLASPLIGQYITHAQILHLYTTLKAAYPNSYPHLLHLLQGSKVYHPPAPPKPQPTSEYTALMTRLRADEEARQYARMVAPSPGTSTSASIKAGKGNPYARFAAPRSSSAWGLGSSADADFTGSKDAEEASLKDVDSQISLIVNIFVSILACGGAFFLLLRYTGWSEGVRVLASMLGAVIVGVAEVGVYAGFVRKTEEGKLIEKKMEKKETREVVETWIIDGKGKEVEKIANEQKESEKPEAVRRRKRRVKDGAEG